ncbi:two-component regulator propeller domain-containing protein [Arenimonas sp.]|uniref:two-component regulator propeller domain-containing protein n=1 Tax=Arenimonas sp. TaxID=1872635 RepID=UPI0039E5595D
MFPTPPALRRSLAALASALLLSAVAAQERPGLISFQRLAMPDDVPAHLCAAMTQDEQGFLWIGTQDGLVRFDGYGHRVWRPVSGDAHSLGGSYVRSLFAARDGRVWVGTFSGGVSVFDPRSERFTQYRHDDADAHSLAQDRVEGIAEDRDGALWFATNEGLDRLSSATGRFEHFRHSDAAGSLAADQVRALLVDRGGTLWVGSRDGLQRWVAKTRRFERVASDPSDAASLAGQLVVRLMEDRQGRLWVATAEHGAALLDPARGTLRRFKHDPASPQGLSHYWVYGFAEVGDRELWVATFGGGIDVIDTQTLQVIDRLHHDAALTGSIGSDRIGCLRSDRSGLVWVGTWGAGLMRHDPSTRAFQHWRYSPERRDGPTHPSIVRSLSLANGQLWLGTNGNGIDVMDRDGRVIGGYRPDPKRPGALSDGSITALGQGTDGVLWAATLNGNLHRLAPGAKDFRRFDAEDGLPRGPIRTMAFAPDGALWVGSAEGMARIGPDLGVRAYRHDAADANSLSGRSVESLAFARDGTLWVGTENGLNAFDTASGRATRIQRDPRRSDSLPDNWIPDLMIARDGRLWVGTQMGAAILTHWDGKQAKFDVLAPRLGLPPRPVESIIEDDDGQVWFGARLRIDPKTWKLRSFGPSDGNDIPTLFIASRVRTPEGRLLFGSAEGLLIVDPARLRRWTFAPQVVATEIRVEGAMLPGATQRPSVRLEHGERDLRVDFAALDFSAPQKLRYRYRLDPYDARWNEAGSDQRSAAYPRLPPGQYTLRVQGSNREGVWSGRELVLPVRVMPAWYQTLGFRLAMLLAAALLLYLFYRLRVRQLRARSVELAGLVRARTAELETAYQRIELASVTDPLTGLGNRRRFEQSIGADLKESLRRHAAADRSGEDDLVFFLLDLDHLKKVNDGYGHAAGDAVLAQTATVIESCLRASDQAIRWGGEEFLLTARFVDRARAAAMAETLRAAIAAHEFRIPGGNVLRRTCSIGFASFPLLLSAPSAVDVEPVLQLADAALHRAKRAGRNRWVGIAATERADTGDGRGLSVAVRAFLGDADAAVAAGLFRLILPAGDSA